MKPLTLLPILLSILLALPLLGFGQKLRLKEANRYYERFQFEKALGVYHKILEKHKDNPKAIIRIANIHRVLDNDEQAAKWYAKVVQLEEAQPEHYFFYAQALRSLKQYDKAVKYYQIYAGLAPYDERGIRLAEGCQELPTFFEDSLIYSVHQLSINSPEPDFSPAYYRNNSIVFASGRAENEGERKDLWSQAPFLDLYITQYQGIYTDPKLLPGFVNTRFHEGPLAFTDSFSHLYFTRNNFLGWKKNTSSEGVIHLSIYEAEYQDGEWGKIKGLPFNSNDYSVGHPTLSPDGDTMYFSSDMPGSIGRLDIWRVVKEDGKWGEPVNLGETINTRGNEHFPFYHSSGKLYYASDGLPGLGGMDIYVAEKRGNEFTAPSNIGYPINSNADDFGIILNEKENEGYFSSNRKGKETRDDIYSLTVAGILVKGLVYDQETKEPLSLAKIHLIQGEDTLTSKEIGKKKGVFLFNVMKGQEYKVVAEKQYYETASKMVSTTKLDSNVVMVRIPLKKAGEVNLAGTVVNAKTREPLDEAKVILSNLADSDTSSMVTAPDGRFSFPLAWNKDYYILSEKHKYFMQDPLSFTTKGLEKPQNIDTVIELHKLEPDAIIKLDNIYFDLAKWAIRPDAEKVLDKLVKLMDTYPAMTLEMRSHTDSRGSDSYNMTLSRKRAESTANYVVSKGIAQSRITGKGFGETQLVNECSNGVRCTEDQHQQNRRTEFRVIDPPAENVEIRSSKAEKPMKKKRKDSMAFASTEPMKKKLGTQVLATTQQVGESERLEVNESMPTGYYAVLGAFKEKENARKFRDKNTDNYEVGILLDANGFYRVVHFLANERSSAVSKLNQLRESKNRDLWMMKHQ